MNNNTWSEMKSSNTVNCSRIRAKERANKAKLEGRNERQKRMKENRANNVKPLVYCERH